MCIAVKVFNRIGKLTLGVGLGCETQSVEMLNENYREISLKCQSKSAEELIIFFLFFFFQWSDVVIKDSPDAQTQFQLKEKLYLDAIDFLDKGKVLDLLIRKWYGIAPRLCLRQM